MGRNTERGQMTIEMIVFVVMFVGLFLIAIGITESGERAEHSYRFQMSAGGPRR